MIVVADTSIILNLCWLGQEQLLAAIYQEVFVAEEVRREFERKVENDARFVGLHFPGFVKVGPPVSIPSSLATNRNLHAGEIATLALALERGIADVLIDEQAARRAAIVLGLHVSGVLGVLIEAKRRQLIPELRPHLDGLVSGARFWIAPMLRERVLRIAGEAP